MGIYLNPNSANFEETLKRPIFVDKTMILKTLNRFIDEQNKYICVSRPRRFGKTIASNIISSYYSKGCNSREIFSKLKFGQDEDFESKLNKFNFIKIDLNSEYRNCRNRENVLSRLQDKVIQEFIEAFPKIKFFEDDSIAEAIQKVFTQTGEQFFILIDEYDVFVREQVNGVVSDELFTEYLDFLNGLFKSDTLKPAIALAYLTGILPIVRDRVQSKLNNFEEYTMLSALELTEFVGFNSDEVEELCSKYKIDFEECKRWYDGYRLSRNVIDGNNDVSEVSYEIYNPQSVVKLIETREFANYWSKTSTYKVISDRLHANFDGTQDDVVRMLGGESVDVNVTRYLNTMTDFTSRHDVFTYLIHLGYLVYDKNEKTCRIPNGEIRQEWENAVEDCDEYKTTNQIIKHSKELLQATLEGEEEAVAEALDLSHIHATSNRSYNSEDGLQCAIYLSYIYALNKYTIVKEMTAGKGFADVTFIPYVEGFPAIIIELKRNGDERTAVNQIKEKKYFASLEHYTGDLLFVGINYDEETKKHVCKMEKFVKD